MGASMDSFYRDTLDYGEPDYEQVRDLSRNLNLSTLSIEELRKKFIMYRGRNGKLSANNYIIFYKEYVNLYACDLEILKSFNAFDKNRDGFLSFSELLTAIAWHTGVCRPQLVCYETCTVPPPPPCLAPPPPPCARPCMLPPMMGCPPEPPEICVMPPPPPIIRRRVVTRTACPRSCSPSPVFIPCRP